VERPRSWMFGGTSTLRDPSHNVANWNMNARNKLCARIHGERAAAFQWVCDPGTPDAVSKRETRFSMKA
jgi:hypothetical protein